MILIAAYSFSQEAKRITWGIHAGVNLSNISDKENGMKADYKSMAGFIGGLDVELPISDYITIQPELNFSQLGAKQNIDTLGNITAKLKENYLSLPVLVKFTVPNTGLGIYVGPQYSYLLSAKATGNVDGSNTSATTSLTDYYKKANLPAYSALNIFSHAMSASQRGTSWASQIQ